MLKHEHALLLRQQCHDDILLHGAARPATADGPAQGRSRPWLGGCSAPIATTESAKWTAGFVGAHAGAGKVLPSPSSSRRLSGRKRVLTCRGGIRVIVRAHNRRGEGRGCPARCRCCCSRRSIVDAVAVRVSIKTKGLVARVLAVALGWLWLGCVLVALVDIGRTPGIILVVHGGLLKGGWRPGCGWDRCGILGRWSHGPLWQLRAEFAGSGKEVFCSWFIGDARQLRQRQVWNSEGVTVSGTPIQETLKKNQEESIVQPDARQQAGWKRTATYHLPHCSSWASMGKEDGLTNCQHSAHPRLLAGRPPQGATGAGAGR